MASFFKGPFPDATPAVQEIFLFAYGECPLVMCHELKLHKNEVEMSTYLDKFTAADAALSQHTLKMSTDPTITAVPTSETDSTSSDKTKGRPKNKTSMNDQVGIYNTYWKKELQCRKKVAEKPCTFTETKANILTWYGAAKARMNVVRLEKQEKHLSEQAKAIKAADIAAALLAANNPPVQNTTAPVDPDMDFEMYTGEMESV